MSNQNLVLEYVLRLADNNLILGQRLSELCGHAPELETDIALTNIALDLVGQSRNLYQYAAELEGKGRTEDDFAFLRDVTEFKNVLLVEQPNEDFAHTIVRQFYFDVFNSFLYSALCQSEDKQLAAIAEKASKEIKYHLRFSSEWMIRLGDGTDLSHDKMQEAVLNLWDFVSELVSPDAVDIELAKIGIAVDLHQISRLYDTKIREILAEATLDYPQHKSFQKGGKQGKHTEYLGLILAEMQWMQRAYPNAIW